MPAVVALLLCLVCTGCRPVVLIMSPRDGDTFKKDELVSFSCIAGSIPDVILRDSSIVWTSSRDGQLGAGSPLVLGSLSAGVHTINVTATNSGDRQAYASIRIYVGGNQVPSALIKSPVDGQIFAQGDEMLFEGQGTDPEDAIIDDASFTWESSLDGMLGTGSSFTRSNLTAGNHIITLTVRDSEGAEDAASVSITVKSSDQTTTTTTMGLPSITTTVPFLSTTSSVGSTTTTAATGWVAMRIPSPIRFQGIWGTSATNVYAVGGDLSTNAAKIFHYNGTAWSEVLSASDSGRFYTVWGSSENDIYAVGGYTEGMLQKSVIYHYDGTCWSETYSSSQGILFGVWGDSATDVLAVGGTSAGPWGLRYDGSNWRVNYSKILAGAFFDIGGISSANIFAAAGACEPPLEPEEPPKLNGMVFYSIDNGDSWEQKLETAGVFLLGVWGSGSTVFAVGGHTGDKSSGTVLSSLDSGETWSAMSIDAGAYCLNDIWGTSASNVYAVGEGGEGAVFHFDGTAWTQMPQSGMMPLCGIWGSSEENIFAVGDGVVLQYCP